MHFRLEQLSLTFLLVLKRGEASNSEHNMRVCVRVYGWVGGWMDVCVK